VEGQARLRLEEEESARGREDIMEVEATLCIREDH
jgi:hypothetical protein